MTFYQCHKLKSDLSRQMCGIKSKKFNLIYFCLISVFISATVFKWNINGNSIKSLWLSREQSLGKIWKRGISFRTEHPHSLGLVFGALEMCVILLDGVQHHFTNTARVTPAQACNTKQKTDSDLKAERKQVPAETLLKLFCPISRFLLSIIDCFLFLRLPWLTKSK